MLPEKFTIGSKVTYVYKAHVVPFADGETQVRLPSFEAESAPTASKETRTPTQSELDQHDALAKLDDTYKFVNKQLVKSAKVCSCGTNVGLRHTKLIRDLATDHLENRQSVGAIPQNVAAATAKRCMRYVTYRGTEGTLKNVEVRSDEELRIVLAEQQRADAKVGYTSDEDNAIRAQLDAEFGSS